MIEDEIYSFGNSKYKLRVGNDLTHAISACNQCAFLADEDLCEIAGNHCTKKPNAWFVLEEKDSTMLLPTDSKERKSIPITSGVLDYFPLAIAEVAKASYAGNQQHHPNEPLFWDKSKSTDHGDCIARHLIDRGELDSDGIKHSAKLAWRALALLQIELENEKE